MFIVRPDRPPALTTSDEVTVASVDGQLSTPRSLSNMDSIIAFERPVARSQSGQESTISSQLQKSRVLCNHEGDLCAGAEFQITIAPLQIRSSFSCLSPLRSSSVSLPSRSRFARTSGRME